MTGWSNEPVKARAYFTSLLGHSFQTKCVFTGFSPSNIRAYKGPVVFSDPPLADHPGPLRNAAQVQGNIVIIRRGGVSFFDKAKRAANAGAAGILFVNNADDVFFAECEGIPCDIPSVTIPLGAYERLADLKMLDPISWFVCVDVPDPALVATCIADTLASGKKLRLHATVVSASGLRNADHDTHLDPFIEITCADQFRRTRTHRGGGSQPIWNQRLNFVLEEGVTHISLRCQDEESSAGADLVGSATVPLDDLFQIQLGTPYAAQVPITSAYGTTAGTVFLQMSLALAPSRCRSSARHAARGAIHVVAICGENLPPPPALGDKGNPFLKVQVGGISKRSPVHKGGHTKAVWNHSMRFLMPRARLGTAPLVRLNLQVWDERDDGEGRRVPLGCEGSIALPALQAKGDLWEGWVSMGGGARVKCKVVCVEAPPAMIASEKKKGAVVRNRGLLDADLALFYMMLFTFLVAVPPLRSVLLWHLLPAVLVSMSVGALLLLGGLVVKRRVFAPILIKSCLGALTDIGHYIEPVGLVKKTADARGGGGRPQFASDVTIENDVSIYQFYCFLFTTGKLTLRRLSIPQPTSREWQLGDDIFLQAECVQVHAAPSTLKTRTPLVHSVIVSGFELSIKVTEGMKSNVLALARSIHESSSCFFRLMGKMEGRVELLRLEAGSLRIVSGELSRGGAAGKDNGADLPPVVVSVDRIDLSDLGCSEGSGGVGYEAAVKRFTVKLLQAVADAQRTDTAVNMHLSFDSEAIWQGFGEDEEDSDDSDDGDDIAVDSQQALPSSPLQPLDDDGPEHIAY